MWFVVLTRTLSFRFHLVTISHIFLVQLCFLWCLLFPHNVQYTFLFPASLWIAAHSGNCSSPLQNASRCFRTSGMHALSLFSRMLTLLWNAEACPHPASWCLLHFGTAWRCLRWFRCFRSLRSWRFISLLPFAQTTHPPQVRLGCPSGGNLSGETRESI